MLFDSFLELSERRNELEKCVNCGLCQAVCPTYLLERHERLTARGKIILLRSLLRGDLPPSRQLADILDDCLTCYACQTVCPAGVQTRRLWAAARQDLAGLKVAGGLKRAVLRLTIGKPRMFAVAARSLSVFRSEGRKMVRLIRRAEFGPAELRSGTVALLVGCSVWLAAPDLLGKTIGVLTAAGYRVVIPARQVCCGAPAVNNGDWATARKLADINLRVFGAVEADWVTSVDGTCLSALREDYVELFSGDEVRFRQSQDLAAKCEDLSRLVRAGLHRLHLGPYPVPTKVTVHDSCHVTHAGPKHVWSDLLQLVPNLQLAEMSGRALCCGFGGSFAIVHRAQAMEIAGRKLDEAVRVGADVICVGSPGCRVHLRSAARARGDELRIHHAVELIAEALVLR